VATPGKYSSVNVHFNHMKLHLTEEYLPIKFPSEIESTVYVLLRHTRTHHITFSDYRCECSVK
jgi:hypothetical protein